MAETLLSFGVQKLWDLLVRESDRFKEVDEQLNELKSDLNLLRSFLIDADAKKHASALVRNCVEEIKEIVFDTEDTIETFLLKEELGRSSGIKKRMRRLSCILVDRREIASDMRGISKRISKVIRDMQSFGVQQMVVDGSVYSETLQERHREMRHTFPRNYENDLVGLEENVKKLVGCLVEEDSIQVVAITGMGGIGKTTLARQVFNHEMVKNSFSGLAWVCVSQQFTRKYVWQTMLKRLSPKHDEDIDLDMSEDELQDKLFRLLESNNPLIVFDDIWKEDDWDRIKPVFPLKKGWKILFTSRNERVALHAHPTCVTFKPECLTFEDSWILFQRIAFPRKEQTEFEVDEEMEEMGKQMIKHCGGLPLAVKVLGGLLTMQYTLREWKRVYENIGTNIMGRNSLNDDSNSWLYHVLSLSFEELASYLKHCFLCLAHFPEDYPIDVEKLSYYWAVEGITKTRFYDGATIRDVAEGYIEELAKRNMVTAERDTTTSRFETCHLHDMMREVCLVKAEEEDFVQTIDSPVYTATANSPSPSTKARRLVVHMLDETVDLVTPKLRSLIFVLHHRTQCWRPSNSFFTRLQLMRVLDLYKAQFEGGKLPSSIGKLIHLKYLSLYLARVSHLPLSMRNLKLLLYLNLDVEAGAPLYVPNILKEMQELKYLWLPDEMQYKVNLELGNLVNMETLENFSTKQSSVRDLDRMTRLETLSILFNGGCTMEALSSSLGELRHLENLTIRDYRANIHVDDAEGLVLDCNYLRQLELHTYMPRLPDGQYFPFRLTTITLSGCSLEEDPMRSLEKLLHLNVVVLGDRSFHGKKMVSSANGFPQLQKLVIFGQLELEEWIVEDGAMPLLETLDIGRCQKLKELSEGLRYITSLKKLRTHLMRREWTDRLSKGGEDYYKVQHIRYVLFL